MTTTTARAQHTALGRCMVCGETYAPSQAVARRATAGNPTAVKECDAAARALARWLDEHPCEGPRSTYDCDRVHTLAGIDLRAMVDAKGRPPVCRTALGVIGSVLGDSVRPEARWATVRAALLDEHWALGCWTLQAVAALEDPDEAMRTGRVACQCGSQSGAVTGERAVVLGWHHSAMVHGGAGVEVVVCRACSEVTVTVDGGPAGAVPLAACSCSEQVVWSRCV